MLRFVVMRALKAVGTIWIVVTATFFLLRLLPGDPTVLMVEGDMTPEMRQALLEAYGLDRPLWEQYVAYLTQLAQGNLGVSFRQLQPVTEILVARLPWTLLLAGTAFLVTLAIGVPIGVYTAVHRDSWIDRTLQGFGIAGHALFVPSVAMLLLVFLGAQAGLFPIGGALDPDAYGVAAYVSLAHHLVLPVVSLVLVQLGPYAMTLRTNMLEVLGEDYIKCARARGLSARRTAWKHALRNAMLPTLTLVGLQLGVLAGGAVLTETVFAYPGVGRLIFEAVGQRDYPVLQGAFIMLAVTVVVANAFTDVLYAVLNPRIRL